MNLGLRRWIGLLRVINKNSLIKYWFIMAVNKVIGLILISISKILMLHSITSIYISQCLNSTVSIPSFFTQDMIDFFQFEKSGLGKGIRMTLILILPSLGIEFYKNKKDRLITIPLLLKTAGIIMFTALLFYILFYPFFE